MLNSYNSEITKYLLQNSVFGYKKITKKIRLLISCRSNTLLATSIDLFDLKLSAKLQDNFSHIILYHYIIILL